MEDINAKADTELNSTQYNIKGEIQSNIHEDIYFKYNSVNLVIGKRGSGKTYTVMREMLKLAHLMNEYESHYPVYDYVPKYTQIIYITDKLRDDTCERAIHYIKKIPYVQFEWESTDHALDIINGLSALKAFMANPEEYEEKIPGDNKQTLAEVKQILYCPKNETKIPHTIIILFENRQSRITYFLILQDVQGLNPSMKANVDSLLLFGGFPKHKWNSLTYQMPLINREYTFEGYYQYLQPYDCVLFDYIDNSIKVKRRNDQEKKFKTVYKM